jgi:hypothetical protein
MHRIAQGSIDKFKLLLETDIDPTKQAMVVRLIAEEDEKLKQIARSEKDGSLDSVPERRVLQSHLKLLGGYDAYKYSRCFI